MKEFKSMSKKDKEKKVQTEETAEATAAETEATAAGSVESEESEATPEVNPFREELDRANDKFLRLYADFENFKKRSRAEKDSVYANAKSDTVAALLPALDNMERALAAAEEEDSPLKKGVDMVLNQFRACFEQLGVSSYGEVGDSFDPNIHEAVMHSEEEGVEPNTVTMVLQKGYRLGDKVIRHALVQVAN